jgi:hypothetical protein
MGTTITKLASYRGFKEILYPYIEPVLSLSIDNIYAEVNKTSSTILTWSVSTYERNPFVLQHII